MQWLLSLVIQTILNWLAKLIGQKVKEAKENKEAHEKNEKEAAANTEELKKAETEAERENATDDLARNSF